MTSREKLIDRIKKLQELGDSSKNNSVHEAAAAAAAAQRLAQEYKISMAELEDDGDDDELVDVDLMEGVKTLQPVRWKVRLANELCNNMSCKCVYTSSRRMKPGHFRYAEGKRVKSFKGKIQIMGKQSDVDAVAYMYQVLCREIVRLCERGASFEFLPGYPGKRTWCTAFRLGAVRTVALRLAEQQRTFKEELLNNVKAGAMIRKADEDLKEFVKSIIPNMHAGPRTPIQDVDGYLAGKRAGQDISLGSSGKLHKPAAQLGAGEREA